MGTDETKIRVHKLVNNYDELSGVFVRFTELVKKAVKSCEKNVFGISEVRGSSFTGFGQTVSMTWKFVIYSGEGYGKLMISLYNSEPFYTIFFKKSGLFKKTLEQDANDFTLENYPEMETMLYEIIDRLFEQQCFKER